jgi:hypothetical protein
VLVIRVPGSGFDNWLVALFRLAALPMQRGYVRQSFL